MASLRFHHAHTKALHGSGVIDVEQSRALRFEVLMTDCIDQDGFRANVGIVLMRADRSVFLGGRTGGRGWQFPQGGMQPQETPEQALYRELREEVGLEPGDVQIVASSRRWLRYRLPRQYVRRNSMPICIGQKQRWFLLLLSSPETHVRFDATGQPEFETGQWVNYWTPVREVIYFKRAVYARALHELARLAFPDDPPPLPDWSAQDKHLRRFWRQANDSLPVL